MGRCVSAILTGKSVPFQGEKTSAIAKSPVLGLINIGALGLQGDEQADRIHHGGVHMALHLYSQHHYSFWRENLGGHPLLDTPGAFGENLAVEQMSEEAVCIGDRFRLGTALIEISQPRQPCWKIEHRFGHKGMVAAILQTGRCGIYFRVLEPGAAKAGDFLEQVDNGHQDWSVRRVFNALFGIASPAGQSAPASLQEFKAIAQLDCLSPQLRERARNRCT